jgi:hypothetical protein
LIEAHPRRYRFSGYEGLLHSVSISEFFKQANSGNLDSLASKPDKTLLATLQNALVSRCEAFLRD